MRITGAVLGEVGRPGPWAQTRPLTMDELAAGTAFRQIIEL